MELSIISINYNNKIGLEKTIKSVAKQVYKNFEYIIIDGGSTDGSVEIIKSNEDSISYWISEPDKGIYNAMNKGITKATGNYLLFLNSGDWLSDEDSLSSFLIGHENYDIVYGNWYLHYLDNKVVEDTFPDLITFYFLAFQYSLPHQASIIKRSFLIEHGMYDENLKMVSDWKFFLQAIFKWNCKYLHKPIFVSCYDKQGFSSNTVNEELQKRERQEVLVNGFRNFLYIEDETENFQRKIDYYEYSKLFKFIKRLKTLKKNLVN